MLLLSVHLFSELYLKTYWFSVPLLRIANGCWIPQTHSPVLSYTQAVVQHVNVLSRKSTGLGCGQKQLRLCCSTLGKLLNYLSPSFYNYS